MSEEVLDLCDEAGDVSGPRQVVCAGELDPARSRHMLCNQPSHLDRNGGIAQSVNARTNGVLIRRKPP